jgi:hypothetical protein
MKYTGNSIASIKYRGDITGYLRRDLGIIESKDAYRVLWFHFLEVSGTYLHDFGAYTKFFVWFCGLDDSEIKSILALHVLGK